MGAESSSRVIFARGDLSELSLAIRLPILFALRWLNFPEVSLVRSSTGGTASLPKEQTKNENRVVGVRPGI